MKNSAGGVDDAYMAGPAFESNLRFDLVEDGILRSELAVALTNIRAQLIQCRATLLCQVITIVTGEQRGAARMIKQAIDGWKFTQ